MKTGILIAIMLFSVVSGNSQSIKELLYGGKLKNDTGSVVRKGDDLSTKIDTTTKKPAEAEKPVTKAAVLVTDSAGGVVVKQVDDPSGTIAAPEATTAVDENKPKDNNAVWKSYIEELIGTLKTEVMTSKKIKNGTYSVLIDYAIETDGQITVNSVSSSPSNSYIEEQIKQRLTLGAPQLTPLLGTNGKPRKAAKKQTITLAK